MWDKEFDLIKWSVDLFQRDQIEKTQKLDPIHPLEEISGKLKASSTLIKL